MSSTSIHPDGPPPGCLASLLPRLCRGFERLAIVMLLLTTFLVVLQVAARNVWQVGLPWADELARYGGLGIVYLAIPLLLLQNGHIAVDILSSRVKGRAGRVLAVVNEIIILAFCGLFLHGSYLFLMKAGKFSTPALRMPNLIFYLPVVVGVLLFTLVAVLRLTRAVRPASAGADSRGTPS
ncbi:TRAP transporter small permease subunit [uncultured Castellaniella sp.]|uniref:TRAP transporter small permease n=1 Tax=uncultured Castellaniella sp. TaxID=647907 RepID=UPI002618D19F|nr:TRAP transporter small permease subunit [uncultured Castellaniella sp.]